MAIYKTTPTPTGGTAHYWRPSRFTHIEKGGTSRVMMECFIDHQAFLDGREPAKRAEVRMPTPPTGKCVWCGVYEFLGSDEYEGFLKDGTKYQPELGDEIVDGIVINNTSQ